MLYHIFFVNLVPLHGPYCNLHGVVLHHGKPHIRREEVASYCRGPAVTFKTVSVLLSQMVM